MSKPIPEQELQDAIEAAYDVMAFLRIVERCSDDAEGLADQYRKQLLADATRVIVGASEKVAGILALLESLERSVGEVAFAPDPSEK